MYSKQEVQRWNKGLCQSKTNGWNEPRNTLLGSLDNGGYNKWAINSKFKVSCFTLLPHWVKPWCAFLAYYWLMFSELLWKYCGGCMDVNTLMSIYSACKISDNKSSPPPILNKKLKIRSKKIIKYETFKMTHIQNDKVQLITAPEQL